jgi:hypothetical protein
MTRLTPMVWSCLGPAYPPEPCPEIGATQASAERHTRETGHATVTSQRPEPDPREDAR